MFASFDGAKRSLVVNYELPAFNSRLVFDLVLYILYKKCLLTFFRVLSSLYFKQEVGCNHAQYVGFSTDGFATTLTMRKYHLIWVTARMHIEIYKYPAWYMMI